jgi:hypothetical protein
MNPIRHSQTFALLSGLLLLTACSTPSPVAKTPRFAEADRADFVARYYSDQASYVVKPPLKDGNMMGTRGEVEFFHPCNRADVLKVAADQRGRELAVVVLIYYPGAGDEEIYKLAWLNDLKGLGYQRVVFLRGANNMEVNGLCVLESPSVLPAIAGK